MNLDLDLVQYCRNGQLEQDFVQFGVTVLTPTLQIEGNTVRIRNHHIVDPSCSDFIFVSSTSITSTNSYGYKQLIVLGMSKLTPIPET